MFLYTVSLGGKLTVTAAGCFSYMVGMPRISCMFRGAEPCVNNAEYVV